MSYHTTTPAAARQSTTNTQGKTAPTGYHYMPDGSLMSDADHASLYGGKIIKSLNLDTSGIKQAGERRKFTVLGDKGAVFSLEIREGLNYYNFETNLFQTTQSRLTDVSIAGNSYSGNISFPNAAATDTVNGAVTSGIKVVMDTAVASTMEVGDRVTGNAALNAGNVTVAALNPDGDNTSEFSLSEAIAIADDITLSFTGSHQYDVYLFAESNFGTSHAEYAEVRSSDGAIDINSSTGSNSNLIQKVIYQTLDVTLTLSNYAPNTTITGATASQVITTSRNASVGIIPFSFTWTVGTSNTLAITKQPTSGDVIALITATPAATPINIPGEDVYPAVTNTDTINGAITSGTRYIMDTNVADKMAAGDKITTAVTTDTVDGSISVFSGSKIVMTNNVAGKMNVGDAITGHPDLDRLSAVGTPFTVAALNPDSDNVKEFSVGGGPRSGSGGALGFIISKVASGTPLTFSSILNRETITVAALNPDDDNAKEFSSSAAFAIIDGTTLSFSNQRNHRWSFDNIHRFTSGMRQLASTFFSSQPIIKEYLTQTTVNEGEYNESKIDNVRIPALDTSGVPPVTTRDGTTKVETTVQTGNVTFSEQALLTFGGGANATIFSYGESEIESLTGYDVEFTDLAVALTEITTTTTAASSNSTSVVIADRIGISDNISSVSGIGIDSSVANPTVASGAGTVTGAGTIVLSAAQTLESGITLTFPGAGSVATITGNIKVNKAGNENVILRFDLEKFLTMQ